MRFKVDENLPVEVAAVLTGAGHDAVTVSSQGLGGAADLQISAICRAERRVLIALDQGFADIAAYPPSQSPGLIVLRLRSQAKHHALAIIYRMMPLLTTESLEHHLWIVDEARIRIRGNDGG